MIKKLRVGIAGLGRLGKVHAGNLAHRIPNAELVAACSIMEHELEYARKELGVQHTYRDFREMIQNPDIDAVAIVTPAGEHCWQIEAALDAGKHVFADKPMGVTLDECKNTEAAVARHPELTFFMGFMRRYDPSYAYAKKKIEEGAIGTPYMVKATGIDPDVLAESVIPYAATSGGIFFDMASHDIDLMRWFLGAEPVEVYAQGTTFKHPGFKDVGDDETAVATYKFDNGAIGFVHVGRCATHGYHIETEIIGTEGSIRISPVPEKNLAVLYNANGVVTECVENFQVRFAEAFRLEMQEFADCVLTGRAPGVNVHDGTQSTKICFATTEAWKSGRLIQI